MTNLNNYSFSDFINRKTSIKQHIDKSRSLEELFSISGKDPNINQLRFKRNIIQPSRGAFKFLLNLNKKTKVLDIGCGYGAISTAIAPHVKQVVGIDPDSNRLMFTQKRAQLSNIKNLKTIKTKSGIKLPFTKDSFDLVIINGVLEWVPTTTTGNPKKDQLKFLKEVKRVLKPGGQVYLGIENRFGYPYFLGKPDDHSHLLFASLLPRFLANFYSQITKDKPYRTYTHSWWGYRSLFRQAGLNILNTYYPSPNYKYIEHIYSHQMNRNHSPDSFLNLVRNLILSPWFLKIFAPSFSIIAGQNKQSSLVENLISKRFKKFSLKKYIVNSQKQTVKVLFTSKQKHHQLSINLLNNHTLFKTLASKQSLRQALSALFIKTLLFLEPLIPKQKNLIVLGGLNGKFYGDNSKHLFKWLLKHRPKLKPVWVTADKGVFNSLKKQSKPVVKYNSLKGIFTILRAPLACYTNSAKDIFFSVDLLPRKLKLLSLRHGRSVKRVRFARVGHKITPKEAHSRKLEGKKIIYAISTSDFVSKIQEECLQIGKDKHMVTGYPRNDSLLKPSKKDRQNFSKLLLGKKYKKIVLYAPSWRHGRVATKFFPFIDLNLKQLSQYLEKTNTAILLRPHVNDLIKYKSSRKSIQYLALSSPNIILATHNQAPDVYSLLPFTDILITDYSALYHDFLLLSRPIFLVPYDFQDFKKQNGFLYNYKKFAPGPIIKSQQQLIKNLNSKDEYKTKRKKLTQLIYKYQDGRSSQRVASLIGKILKNG